jgi:tetratricopeptide (TPR) repeat protein
LHPAHPLHSLHPAQYAIAIAPYGAYSANGNMAFLEGDLEEALAFGEKALALSPEESSYYLNQALVLVNLGRGDAAKGYLDRARKVDGSRFLAGKIASLEARWGDRAPPPAEPRRTPALGN